MFSIYFTIGGRVGLAPCKGEGCDGRSWRLNRLGKETGGLEEAGGSLFTSAHVTEAGEEKGEEEIEDDEVTHEDGGHEIGDTRLTTEKKYELCLLNVLFSETSP